MSRLTALFICPKKAEPMVEVPEARVVVERGIEGDRYFAAAGTFSKNGGNGRHVTLVEAEALAAAAEEERVSIPAALCRRNLLVEGVYLNHLVGKEFDIGAIRLVGRRLCEPCDHMEKLSAIRGARAALIHRGGLRCDVVRGGVIRVGDAVVV